MRWQEPRHCTAGLALDWRSSAVLSRQPLKPP